MSNSGNGLNVSEQSELITDWEETDNGIRADIAADAGRIQTEVEFHDDGSVTEEVVILDQADNEMVTETVEYDWEEVQRGFLKDVLRDYTDRAGDSRRVRLTRSEASALATAAENVADVYEDKLNPDAIEDIRNACERLEEAFTTPDEPRVNAGRATDGGRSE